MIGSKKTGEIGRFLESPQNLLKRVCTSAYLNNVGGMVYQRGKYYHSPRITKDEHSAFKEKIRVKYTLDPSSGSRRITAAHNRDGIKVQRRLIRMLMKVMNLKGLTPKKKLNYPKDSAHKLPYLLRDIEIIRPNQV